MTSSRSDFQFDPKATRLGYGAFDIVVNVYTPQAFAEGRIPTDDDFRSKVRVAEPHRRGVTIEEYLEKMDRAGIERSFLAAVRCGQDKLLFGTDWAVIDPERAMTEVMALEFRPGSLRKILRDSAARIFNLRD